MRIATIEDLHCNAGWRDFSFLKITTDDGLVGWSEYLEGYGSGGLTGVIHRLGALLIGEDPRPVERHSARLYAVTRQAPGGSNQQAIAATEFLGHGVGALCLHEDVGVGQSCVVDGRNDCRSHVLQSLEAVER